MDLGREADVSADNYYRIHKWGDRYFVTCDFASDENWETTEEVVENKGDKIRFYETLEEAEEYAYSEYAEYGVVYAFPTKVVET